MWDTDIIVAELDHDHLGHQPEDTLHHQPVLLLPVDQEVKSIIILTGTDLNSVMGKFLVSPPRHSEHIGNTPNEFLQATTPTDEPIKLIRTHGRNKMQLVSPDTRDECLHKLGDMAMRFLVIKLGNLLFQVRLLIITSFGNILHSNWPLVRWQREPWWAKLPWLTRSQLVRCSTSSQDVRNILYTWNVSPIH